MYSATSGWTKIEISWPGRLPASSSTTRKICRAAEFIDLIRPVPAQWGQVCETDSASDGRNLWRDISSSPKWLMDPTCIRARSCRNASFNFRSMADLFRFSSISMKSITIRPDKSLSFSCRPTSSAASKFVLSAVSSIFRSRVALPEFTSIATKASVWLMTRYPPDFRVTSP